MSKLFDLVSVGTVYLDIDAVNFPFHGTISSTKELVSDDYELNLGGSATIFAKTATKLGMHACFIGKVGQDQIAESIKTLLEKDKIASELITSESAKTNIGLHFVNDKGEAILTSVGTANQQLTIAEVVEKLDICLPKARYLYLGGYFKQANLMAGYQQFISLAKVNNCKVVLDHGRVNNTVTQDQINNLKELISQVDIYLPSEEEFLTVWETDTVEKGLEKMSKQDNLVVVKQAHHGVTALVNNQIIHQPAFNVTVANSVGAGDSFNAGFIKALEDQKQIQDCMRFASATAAIKISQASPPTLDQVLDFISANKA